MIRFFVFFFRGACAACLFLTFVYSQLTLADKIATFCLLRRYEIDTIGLHALYIRGITDRVDEICLGLPAVL